MSFDAVDAYLRFQKAYGQKRGWIAGDASGMVPNTNWGDVIAFYRTFLEVTNDPSSCLADEFGKSPLTSLSSFLVSFSGLQTPAAINQCKTYVLSSKFQSALADFKSRDPMGVAWRLWGPTYPVAAALAVTTRQTYPDNAAFWLAARRYAIARSAAGAVQGSINRFADSLSKSLKDLPKTVADAVRAVNPLPSIGWIETLVKVALVSGAGILGYNLYRATQPRR